MENIVYIAIITFSLLCEVNSVNPSGDGGLVNRLMSQRETLIQDGLSYTNFSATNPREAHNIRLEDVRNLTRGHKVRCIINIENWTKWTLVWLRTCSNPSDIKQFRSDTGNIYFLSVQEGGYPVFYLKHGMFQKGFHEREVFPSHREIVITGNHVDHSFTGTSGVIGWELEQQGVHLIVMWTVPYSGIFNPYFGIGVVKLTTTFTQDMLPYWYKQMYDEEKCNALVHEGPGTIHLAQIIPGFFEARTTQRPI